MSSVTTQRETVSSINNSEGKSEESSEVLVSIGTAARLIGVSTHVLRAWEKRYALDLATRDTAGRRVYKPSSIEHLKLLKECSELGYKVSELATLTAVELIELLIAKDVKNVRGSQENGEKTKLKKWLVYGLNLNHRIFRNGYSDYTVPVDSIMQLIEILAKEEVLYDGVLVEYQQIDDDAEAVLHKLKLKTLNRLPLVVVTKTQDNIQQINRLKQSGIEFVDDSLISDLTAKLIHIRDVFLKSSATVDYYSSELGLSKEQLIELNKLASEIYCECPEHISSLYRQIESFTQYVRGCELLSPKDKVLHAHMVKSLTAIRSDLVRLAVDVAEIEGIALFKKRKS